MLRAGKDRLGIDAFYANEREVVLNQAKVAALKSVYRHGEELAGVVAPSDKQRGKIFASPVANSSDGLGEALTTVDQSWHPFHNKVFQDGVLSEIRMPKADLGYAIASHYLLLAEGTRTITVSFTIAGAPASLQTDYKDDVICLLTGAEGWIEKAASGFIAESGVLRLELSLGGEEPAVTSYAEKVHGYGLATDLPVFIMKLRHRDDAVSIYPQLQDIVVRKITLSVDVKGLRTLAVSNDFGPVDTSKPFQPYGASPVANNALIIGSREVFQKRLLSASVAASWLVTPNSYTPAPTVSVDYLKSGQWAASSITPFALGTENYDLGVHSLLPSSMGQICARTSGTTRRCGMVFCG